MEYSNVRFSITLNNAQLGYLSDECQDINRMKCFKTFLHMAVMEPTKVTRKNFSADLQPGQFIASKVELSLIWKCNRKTATRIIKEFNLVGILHSEPSNRTTVHTLLCLSVWFTEQGMVKSRFFVSNPIVKPIEKPPRKAASVPPKTTSETVEISKPTSTDSAVTSVVEKEVNPDSVHPLITHVDDRDKPMNTSPFSLLSGVGTLENVRHPVTASVANFTDGSMKAEDGLLSIDMKEAMTSDASDGEPRLISPGQSWDTLQKGLTKGKTIDLVDDARDG